MTKTAIACPERPDFESADTALRTPPVKIRALLGAASPARLAALIRALRDKVA